MKLAIVGSGSGHGTKEVAAGPAGTPRSALALPAGRPAVLDAAMVSAARRALGRLLADYRCAAGYTQHTFAARAGCSRGALPDTELGLHLPRRRDFWQHCEQVPGLTPGYFATPHDRIAAWTAQLRRRRSSERARQQIAAPPTSGPRPAPGPGARSAAVITVWDDESATTHPRHRPADRGTNPSERASGQCTGVFAGSRVPIVNRCGIWGSDDTRRLFAGAAADPEILHLKINCQAVFGPDGEFRLRGVLSASNDQWRAARAGRDGRFRPLMRPPSPAELAAALGEHVTSAGEQDDPATIRWE